MTISPLLLSGSTNGRNIKVTGTSSGAAVTVHTAVSGTSSFDEVTLFAANTSASDVLLTIEAGGTTSPDDQIKVTVPANSQRMVLPSIRYNNSVAIKAFAATGNVINIFGNVNRFV